MQISELKVCGKLAHMGIWIDEEKNQAVGSEAAIAFLKMISPVTIEEAIPANEELGVARKTYAL